MSASMSDRELLIFAAKAAGIELWPGDPWCSFTPNFEGVQTKDGKVLWRPQQDNGDSFRLAVAADLCITQWRNHSEYPPHVMVGYRTGPNSGSNWIEEYGRDDMAANRRAILCAAAERGKAMP